MFICNWTWTHNHLVPKQTLNHLAKLAKMTELHCENLPVWSIWLYVLIISRTCFRVNPHSTLYSCLNLKELLAQNRHEIWTLSDWNCSWTYNHLVRKRTLNHLAKLAKMIELCCEKLSVWCIWLYVLIVSPMCFRVKPPSAVAWMSRNSLLKTGMKTELWGTATGLELTTT